MNSTLTQGSVRRPDRKQLVIAAALGLAAAVLIVVFLSKAETKTTTTAEATISVVVASEPIVVGQRITSDHLSVRSLPTSALAKRGKCGSPRAGTP